MTHKIISLLLLFGMAATPAAAKAASGLSFELFMASAKEVLPGEKVTLAWRVPDATKCQLRDNTNGDGKLLLDGLDKYLEQDVFPQKTTVYLVHCTRLKYKDGRSVKDGQITYSVQKSVKVTVKKVKAPVASVLQPSCTLKATDKSKDQLSGPVKLVWKSEHAEYALLTVDYSHGTDVHKKKRYKPNGTLVHKPQQSARYRLTFFGDGGTASCEAEIARKG